jgi:protoheme IX farnesyltransferase
MTNREESVRPAAPGLFAELVMLFKGRIVLLLLVAALGGAFVGAGGWPGIGHVALIIVTGGLAAMGAAALNEYIERENDGLMKRTRRRPLVAGTISRPHWVPFAGVSMILVPVVAVLPSDPALAAFLALGAFIYVGIYTIWLKRRTPLNIVVGGTAGSCAVLSGGAAVGAWNEPAVVLLALLLFFWTPIHFWALAVVYREDYARAGVPMLPVTTSPRRAAIWGLVHGVGAVVCAMLLALKSELGPVALLAVSGASAVLLAQGAGSVAEPSKRRAWRLFHTSTLFLAIVLVAILAGTSIHVAWPFR